MSHMIKGFLHFFSKRVAWFLKHDGLTALPQFEVHPTFKFAAKIYIQMLGMQHQMIWMDKGLKDRYSPCI